MSIPKLMIGPRLGTEAAAGAGPLTTVSAVNNPSTQRVRESVIVTSTAVVVEQHARHERSLGNDERDMRFAVANTPSPRQATTSRRRSHARCHRGLVVRNGAT
jgi:hypothetical protein